MLACNCVGPGRPHTLLPHVQKQTTLHSACRHSALRTAVTACSHVRLRPRQTVARWKTDDDVESHTEPEQPTPALGSPLQAEAPVVVVNQGAVLEAAILRGAGRFVTHLRRLRWGELHPKELATNMLFVLGVILVNWGVESALNFYLGDSPVGSIGCILLGAGVLTWLKVRRVPVSHALFSAFWN